MIGWGNSGLQSSGGGGGGGGGNTPAYLVTPSINFLTAGTQSFTLNASPGFGLWVDEIDIVADAISGGAVINQPTFEVGILGNLTKYLSAKTTTLLTASGLRDLFNSLNADNEEMSLIVTVNPTSSAPATGPTVYSGRVIIKCTQLQTP